MEIKASLLSSLRLVLYFICVSVLSCLVFGIIYMLYNLCENMVAGQSLLFDMNLFLEGLFVVTPFVFMFGSLLMVLNLVRHPADSLAVMVVYGLISVCLWLLLIPRVVRADVALYDANAPSAVRGLPSASYFRPDGDQVFYYAKITASSDNAAANNAGTGTVTGICMDTAKNNVSDVYTFSGLELSRSHSQFTDTLIQGSLDMPPVLGILVQKFAALNVILKKCATQGRGYWLCFSSMGLALIAVFGLRYVSKWRLVNVMLAICVTIGVVVFNLQGYTSKSFISVTDAVNGVFGKIGLFKKMAAVGNLPVVFCNIIVFILLVVLGFVFELNHRKQLDPESGEMSL